MPTIQNVTSHRSTWRTVDQWISASAEVLVVMRYLGSGAKSYALVTTPRTFRQLVDACPAGTDIIVFRGRQLPLRGVVDEAFIQEAKDLVPDGAEYLYILTTPKHAEDPRCSGEMGDTHGELAEDLSEDLGEYVAIGLCPNFIAADNDVMISASKGGIDGPR